VVEEQEEALVGQHKHGVTTQGVYHGQTVDAVINQHS